MKQETSKEQEAEELERATSDELRKAASTLMLAQRHAILLVEDTAPHAAIIRRVLDSAVWELEHVTRAKTAIDSFESDPHRIVLLDLSLPDSDGLKVLKKLHTINEEAQIIVVTATDQVAVSVEAMQKGACDYVVKSDPKETGERIIKAIEAAWQRRLRSAEDKLIRQTRLVELMRAQRLEAIDVVVRTVCHEVNNPLSGVVALSQLLLKSEGADDNEVKRLAEGISESAQRVAEAVQRLQDIDDNVIEFGGKKILDIERNTPE